MRYCMLVYCACLLCLASMQSTAQTGWAVDYFRGFRASQNGNNVNNLSYSWTGGNLGDTWDEGEWVPYLLVLKNVDLGNANFSPIQMGFDFTNNNARFVDLIRSVQVSSTIGALSSTTAAWPDPSGIACPLTTGNPDSRLLLEDAQKCAGVDAFGNANVWSGYTLLNLNYQAQINRDINGGLGAPDDDFRYFTITRGDLQAVLGNNYTGTVYIYFALHLSQTFVWQFSLQDQLDTPPTQAWGGYLYGINPFDTDSRNGAGYASNGASTHVWVNVGGKKDVPIPVPPAPNGQISGSKWFDADGDGVRDLTPPPAEFPLPGWTIHVSTSIGSVPVSKDVPTDNTGAWILNGLPQATYTVYEVAQGPNHTYGSPYSNTPLSWAFTGQPLPNNTASLWEQTYPVSGSSMTGATALDVSSISGAAQWGWNVDLISSTTVGNIDFMNTIEGPTCQVREGNQKVCRGQTVTLTADRLTGGTPDLTNASPSGYTYLWSGPNLGTTDPTQQSISVVVTDDPPNLATTGMYTVQITDIYGKSSTCPVMVEQHPQPVCSVTPATGSFCEGTTITLSGPDHETTTPSTYVDTWLWSVSGNATISSASNTGQTIDILVGALSTGDDFTVSLTTTTSATNGSCPVTCLYTYDITPLITCPADISVRCDETIPPANISAVTVNCQQTSVIVAHVGDDPATPPALTPHCYTITRTYSATLGTFYTECEQTITIYDDVPPAITVPPSSLSMQCFDATTANNWAATATATDICDGAVNVTYDYTPPTSNCDQIVTVTFSATDACGNTGTAMKTFTVDDTQDPTASNPASVTVECIGDVPAPDITVVTDEADNCTAVPVVAFVGDQSDGNTCPEVITRTYSVTDDCGNSINVYQTITVDDTQDPTASNPLPVFVQCIGDVPAPDITVVTDEADNCTAAPVVAWVSDQSDGNTCPEVITRTYSVTDDCGNSITVTQTITVDDTQDPTASNPLPVTVQCIGDVPAPDITVVTDEADNCTAAPLVAWVSDQSDGNTCPEVITRTYSVTDDCDNSINVYQTITVDDTQDPTASNPLPVSVQCIGDVPAPDITVVTDEADNCTAAPVVVWVSDQSDGNTCPEVITRTYSVTDDCGNSINVTQTITVDDTQDPTASNPLPVFVQCIGDVPAPDITVVTDETDNCTAAPVVAWVSDQSDGNTCPEVITRTYSVTDDCGNSINVYQTITVDDTQDPTASNPLPVTVQCIGDVPTPDITVVTDEADNCTAAPAVAWAGDQSDGNTCPEVITRTYSVTDDCGNSINVYQTITVDDTQDPTASNPLPVSVQCIGDVPAPDITVVTDEADNCTAVPVVAWVGDQSDGLTCPETITRTYSVTDDCGNSINVYQTITVDDTQDPTASNPLPVSVQCIGDVPAPDITVVTDEADNCTAAPVVAWVGDQSDGNTCPEVITRTYSVTDDCGNSINVTQTITVDDTEAPTWITLAGALDATLECSDVAGIAAAQALFPVAQDNCDADVSGIIKIAGSFVAGQTCPQSGTITNTWTVTDDCGNTSGVFTQVITIEDNTPPAWITQPPVGVTVDCATTPIPFWQPVNGTDYSDNCDPNPALIIVVSDLVVPQSDGTKWHTRTWKLVDACQNESGTISQTIIESRCQFASKTQGYYGNAGGTDCQYGVSTLNLLNTYLLTTDLVVGEYGNRSFTVGMGHGSCLIQYLPSGGTASVLQNNDYYFNANNCNIVPGNFSQINNGKFYNILLGQTITFALNLRLDANLTTDLKLPDPTTPYLWTYASDYVNGVCLDGDDVETGSPVAYYIPPAVLTALGSNGSNLGLDALLAFANQALAGYTISPVTLAEVTAALDAYNRGFDNARFFAGYHAAPPPKAVSRDDVPTAFMLHQNHPNPFNPSTTIAYTLPVDCTVRLAIYNALGNEVAVLVDHAVSAGTHAVTWNSQHSGGDIASGVYTYRIVAVSTDGDEFHDVKKMLLVK